MEASTKPVQNIKQKEKKKEQNRHILTRKTSIATEDLQDRSFPVEIRIGRDCNRKAKSSCSPNGGEAFSDRFPFISCFLSFPYSPSVVLSSGGGEVFRAKVNERQGKGGKEGERFVGKQVLWPVG
jgi:hypothetical protein